MQRTENIDQNAMKFQRLVYGFLLLLAFLFDYIPLVLCVGLLMLAFIWLPLKYSPTFLLYQLIPHPPSVQSCTCDSPAARFACGLGSCLLGVSYGLNLGGMETSGWVLVVAVAVLSLIAGTTGFCLGNLVFAWLRKKM